MGLIKVLQVNKWFYPHIGGIEKHVYLLSKELAKLPDVELTALVYSKKFKTEIESLSNFQVIKVASIGTILSMPFGVTFPLWLKKLEADIIHFQHPFPPGELAYLLARPNGKVVVTWQSDIVRQRRAMSFYSPLLHRFLHHVDRIIVTSPNYLSLSTHLQSFREKCVVIPLGINLSQFQPTPQIEAQAEMIRKRYGSPLLLFVGRLVYYKGVEYLLKAMPGISARLLIIGEGPLEPKLKALAENLGVSDRVVFHNHVSERELPAYYHACDVFILPSIEISEAFGLVQLEAMACGKPVISTNLPTGVPFVNQHEKTGLVVPPRDSQALAQAINFLLSNQGLQREYGEYARKRVGREFKIEIIAEKVLQVYKELL